MNVCTSGLRFQLGTNYSYTGDMIIVVISNQVLVVSFDFTVAARTGGRTKEVLYPLKGVMPIGRCRSNSTLSKVDPVWCWWRYAGEGEKIA